MSVVLSSAGSYRGEVPKIGFVSSNVGDGISNPRGIGPVLIESHGPGFLKPGSSTSIDQLNQRLFPQGLQAVFQYDEKAHMTWLNVINKATGQVVDRYPPEKIRQMVDAATTTGLSYDKRL